MLHRSCLVADVPYEECAVRDSSIFMSSMQQLLGIKIRESLYPSTG